MQHLQFPLLLNSQAKRDMLHDGHAPVVHCPHLPPLLNSETKSNLLHDG